MNMIKEKVLDVERTVRKPISHLTICENAFLSVFGKKRHHFQYKDIYFIFFYEKGEIVIKGKKSLKEDELGNVFPQEKMLQWLDQLILDIEKEVGCFKFQGICYTCQ